MNAAILVEQKCKKQELEQQFNAIIVIRQREPTSPKVLVDLEAKEEEMGGIL